MQSADHLMEFAAELARKAGSFILNQRPASLSVKEKNTPVDLVTEMDVRSEQLIVEAIRNRFPKHDILAEEGGRSPGSGSVRWVIDPIDGTTNYAHGYPCYCVSIGVEVEGKVVAGAVYDPNRRELFTALRDAGAWLNGFPIRVSEETELADALLATGFSYRRDEIRHNLDLFCRMVLNSRAVRRVGSAALDLCYVGCGRFDGFWELSLNPWDLAAGSLVVREAGGVVSTLDGKPTTIYQPQTLATNGRIHDAMSRLLTS